MSLQEHVVSTMTYELTETVDVPRGPQKFRELLIYVSKMCRNDPTFGAVKLNKILYYSDFRAFERFGVPITGVRYFKLPLGPAPKALMPIRRQLVEEGAIRLEKVDLGDGVAQHRTIAERNAAMSLFSKDEISLVDDVIKELWGQSARDVSDASHDIRWRAVNMRDTLPYEFAFLSNEPVNDADNQRTSELAKEFGW